MKTLALVSAVAMTVALGTLPVMADNTSGNVHSNVAGKVQDGTKVQHVQLKRRLALHQAITQQNNDKNQTNNPNSGNLGYGTDNFIQQ